MKCNGLKSNLAYLTPINYINSISSPWLLCSTHIADSSRCQVFYSTLDGGSRGARRHVDIVRKKFKTQCPVYKGRSTIGLGSCQSSWFPWVCEKPCFIEIWACAAMNPVANDNGNEWKNFCSLTCLLSTTVALVGNTVSHWTPWSGRLLWSIALYREAASHGSRDVWAASPQK